MTRRFAAFLVVSFLRRFAMSMGSKIPYGAVADCITMTSAWEEGKNDRILEFGCLHPDYGGCLALELIQRGGGYLRVTTWDDDDRTIHNARDLLNEKDKKAASERYRQHPSGQSGYCDEFDLVVSFLGALSVKKQLVGENLRTQEEEERRVYWAMKQAVQACREGGSVIVADMFPWYCTDDPMMQFPEVRKSVERMRGAGLQNIMYSWRLLRHRPFHDQAIVVLEGKKREEETMLVRRGRRRKRSSPLIPELIGSQLSPDTGSESEGTDGELGV